MLKIAFWWGIPCKSMIPVCRELAEIPDVEISFFCENDLPDHRRKLGWVVPSLGKLKFEIIEEKYWKRKVNEKLKQNYDIHIFNGVYLYKKLRYALDKAIELNIKVGVISEAPHNPYFGVRRILKSLFTKFITPFRVKRRAKHIEFLLSASGNEIIKFTKLGWDKNKIYSFGYFPESTLSTGYRKFDDISILLCTGYLTKNKGQALLIQALSLVKKSGIHFNCFITGYGLEQKRLIELIKKLHLENEVHILGVVSDIKLNELKQSTNLFIAPGYEEPWAIRVNEALLSGIPVILSDKIGAAELILASYAGKVFESGNYSSLAENIIYFLSDLDRIEQAHKNAIKYREKILPKTAAIYLLNVVNFSLGRSSFKPSLPPWLSK